MGAAWRHDGSAAWHRPVMLEETLDALAPAPGRTLLDGTLGQGGHAEAWLLRSGPSGRVVGFDRDLGALTVARERLAHFGTRFEPVHGSYKDAADLRDAESFDAVLLDLGLGSHQLDDPERGFSFRFDGPLDMRYDRDRPGRTAAEIVGHAPAPELERIFREYGEEPQARKLARVIVDERQRHPLRTTEQLATLIRRVAPGAPRGRHRIDPATRVFQALRIAVNEELDDLDRAIESLVGLLVPGGRIAVIAFHSLEDRIVKQTLRRLASPASNPDGDPFAPPAPAVLELVERKAQEPSEEEAAANPRARSAHLRWGVRR